MFRSIRINTDTASNNRSNLESTSDGTAHDDGMLQNNNVNFHADNNAYGRNGCLENEPVIGNVDSTIINSNNEPSNRVLRNGSNSCSALIRKNNNDNDNLEPTRNGTAYADGITKQHHTLPFRR